MPQITVERSPGLDNVDWAQFALDLHTVVVETAAARPEACKTRVLRTEDEVVGGEHEHHAIVNVTIALLPGRTEETKALLAERVVELLRKHARSATGDTLHLSAEVRELDASYRKAVV
jgi:5-carboxymethyl-2-hydroxymuconate isomerase